MSELVSTSYSSINDNMSQHVDRMVRLILQLRRMGMTLEDFLLIGILVASIEAQELLPITASVKTVFDDTFN